MVEHLYIIFISKLYSGIFILASGLTPSMFAYLTWERNGKSFKTMIQADKAEKMATEMKKFGVDPKIIIAQPISYIK